MRRAAKRDFVERGIVSGLRELGIHVSLVSGDGLPDAIAYDPRRGTLRLLEFKGKAGKLTKAQQVSHQQLPICVVRSLDEALVLFE